MQISGKHVGIILGISVLVVLTFGCIGEFSDAFNDTIANLDNNTPVKTYSGCGISFNYPGSWQRETEYAYGREGELGGMEIRIKKNDSFDSHDPRIDIYIDLECGHSNQDELNEWRKVNHSSDSSDGWSGGWWHEISNSTLTVDGTTAYMYTLIIDNKAYYGEIMRKQEIRFVKNGNAYEISFEALNEDFDKEKPNFDLMLNSFKVQ